MFNRMICSKLPYDWCTEEEQGAEAGPRPSGGEPGCCPPGGRRSRPGAPPASPQGGGSLAGCLGGGRLVPPPSVRPPQSRTHLPSLRWPGHGTE